MKYERPITTVTKFTMKTTILASSNTDDEEDCGCFAHKGKHSKCGEGCHNSGPKESLDFSSSIF